MVEGVVVDGVEAGSTTSFSSSGSTVICLVSGSSIDGGVGRGAVGRAVGSAPSARVMPQLAINRATASAHSADGRRPPRPIARLPLIAARILVPALSVGASDTDVDRWPSGRLSS